MSWVGFPGGSEVKVSAWNAGDPGSIPGKIPWRRKWHPTPVLLPGESHGGRSLVGYSPWGRKQSDTTERLHFIVMGGWWKGGGSVFPGGSAVKNPPVNAGDSGSVLGLGRSPGERNGKPLQYSCLGNSMDRGAWWVTVQGVA